MIRAASDAQNAITKHSETLGLAELSASSAIEVIRDLHHNSGIQRILEDIKRHEAMMRMAVSPIEELWRVGAFQDESLSGAMELARTAMIDWDARFRLPEIAESVRLMMQFRDSAASEVLRRYADEASSLKHAIESMRTPWLDMQESMRSMSGFAALQGIGHALSNMPAFGDDLASALRIDLGDWRDTITWPTEIFTDLVARSDFYVARGFNPALTDFPIAAFEEALEISGLRGESPPLLDLYSFPIRTSTDDEEGGLARTNTAHNWLLRLETQVRRFIDEEMSKAFGPHWPKHRLPNGLYNQWRDKKRNAEKGGSSQWALIAYADFTDYVLVICKRDNWGIFAPFFRRKEDVRESFQRLYPIRIDTMHARPITRDDELLLYVEVRRLMNVIIGRKT